MSFCCRCLLPTVSALLLGTAAHTASAQSPCTNHSLDEGGVSNAHTRFLETNVLPAVVEAGTQPQSLVERMAAFDIPGISVAVIHEGKLDWARGWGVRDTISCQAVDVDTAFQVASISKLVTAVLALRTVEQGRLSLDADINSTLSSWTLPEEPELAPHGVNLRQLLSHTAGLNVHGFPGYQPGAPLPTDAQILDGRSPANNEAVRIVSPAGSKWQYSGGGYVIVQMALSDASGMSFPHLAQRELFTPLGMTRSAFGQPPDSQILANVALAHLDGKVLPEGYRVYPELGPAGLWTTASDLARLILDIQGSEAGKQGKRLSPQMTEAMLTPVLDHWGLGPVIHGEGDDLRFGHDGANQGYQAVLVAYAHEGEGVIVLTNGEKGSRLANEIVRTVATDYGWDALAAKSSAEIDLPAALPARIAGLYDGGGMSVFLDARADGLFAQTGGPHPERLVPIDELHFRTDASGILIEFAPSYETFRIVENGPDVKFRRVAPPQTDDASVPLYFRGSFNSWSAGNALTEESEGRLSGTIFLPVGDYQLKIGSEDWLQADYGSSTGEIWIPDDGPIKLIPHGGNVRLRVSNAGTYRITFHREGVVANLSLQRVGSDEN